MSVCFHPSNIYKTFFFSFFFASIRWWNPRWKKSLADIRGWLWNFYSIMIQKMRFNTQIIYHMQRKCIHRANIYAISHSFMSFGSFFLSNMDVHAFLHWTFTSIIFFSSQFCWFFFHSECIQYTCMHFMIIVNFTLL